MKWANLTGLLSPVAAILGAATFFPTPAVISAGAGDIVLQSGPARASLLELYTSEGCSSCPPAEAWLSRLRDDARLWKEIVPVAFHVDYWDNLGWKDRFASAAFTARQRDYAARWNSGSVYTPGFVLDGQEWRGWFTGRGAAVPGHRPAGWLRSPSSPRAAGTGWSARRFWRCLDSM